MRVIGLTGSIGMGKTTTAGMFRDREIPTFESDQSVHELYARDRELIDLIEREFPGTTASGVINRARLWAHLADDGTALSRLEALVHPRVRAAQQTFLEAARAAKAPIAVLDIPLLFETYGEKERRRKFDAIIVASAPAHMQRRRVLARPGMTEEKLARALTRQWPDDKKRRLADYIIDTSSGLEAARQQVDHVIAAEHALGRSP